LATARLLFKRKGSGTMLIDYGAAPQAATAAAQAERAYSL